MILLQHFSEVPENTSAHKSIQQSKRENIKKLRVT